MLTKTDIAQTYDELEFLIEQSLTKGVEPVKVTIFPLEIDVDGVIIKVYKIVSEVDPSDVF